jgi:hypothetical protein
MKTIKDKLDRLERRLKRNRRWNYHSPAAGIENLTVEDRQALIDFVNAAREILDATPAGHRAKAAAEILYILHSVK